MAPGSGCRAPASQLQTHERPLCGPGAGCVSLSHPNLAVDCPSFLARNNLEEDKSTPACLVPSGGRDRMDAAVSLAAFSFNQAFGGWLSRFCAGLGRGVVG